MPARPGGALSTRPLHFIFIADCSGSMGGDKIQALNFAIRDSIPHMQKVADENPNANLMVRAVAFDSSARWHISQPTMVSQLRWFDLQAGGQTAMGAALRLVAEALDIERMGQRALPPVLVLISDGQPTDNFREGLDQIMRQPWGKKAVRLAIAIGEDADNALLQEFIGTPEVPVCQANNPEALVRYIKWASTAVVAAASSPASQAALASGGLNVPVPQPPQDAVGASAVW